MGDLVRLLDLLVADAMARVFPVKESVVIADTSTYLDDIVEDVAQRRASGRSVPHYFVYSDPE